MTLDEIALKYITDKSSVYHNYTPIYDKYFSGFRNDEITLVEGGIGGYHLSNEGGGSLLMWQEYFQRGKIYGFDIYNKSFLNTTRIKTFIGSQDDSIFLTGLFNEIGTPDVFIDDCSHDNPLTIKTLEFVFPKLKSGGIYCIEDVHTSYWDEADLHGTKDLSGGPYTSVMNYCKRLADDLNHEHIAGYISNPNFKNQLQAIHFYTKIIFLFKS